jgi:integrase
METVSDKRKAKRSKWPQVTRRKNPGGTISFCVDMGRVNGKRERKFFKARAEADTYADQQRTARENMGTAAFSIDDALRHDAISAKQILAPFSATLTEAAKYFVKHARPRGGSKSMCDLVTEVLDAKQKAGRRPTTVADYRYLFNRFNRSYGERMAHDIHQQDVEQWLDGNTKSLATRRIYIKFLSTLFAYALKRGYMAVNPLDGLERPQVLLKAPAIFTVDQTISLLRSVIEQSELELLTYVSIGLFAGLRPTEMIRLDWSNVRLDQRVVLVNADASKTSQKRFVDVSDNLLAWLAPIAKESGPLAPRGLRFRLRDAWRGTENYERGSIDKWPQDGMRHSFASYHLAHHKNAPLTSLQMGHMSPQMLFNHYRNLVLATDAERYWNITPELVQAELEKARRAPVQPEG